MKGSIIRRGPESWAIKVDLGRDPQTRQRRTKWHTIRGTKREAQSEAGKWVAAVTEIRRIAERERLPFSRLVDAVDKAAAAGLRLPDLPAFLQSRRLNLEHVADGSAFASESPGTVGAFLTAWLENTVKTRVRGKTFERYDEIVRKHLVPALGDKSLAALRPADIRKYHATALASGRRNGKGGLSALTVKHHHRVLSQALQMAVSDGLIPSNPCAGKEQRPPMVKRREISTIDPDQSVRLLEAARPTSIFVPVLLALMTGVRRSEALALRWQDVNLDAAVIAVTRSLEQTADGLAFNAPKTAKGRRTITLPALAVEELRAHKARQAAERLKLGPLYEDAGLVCAGPDGRPMSPRDLTKAFGRLAKRLKLPVTFHGLRHSHISQMLAAGVHMKVASERAGHSGIAITMDTYSHVMEGLQEDAAKRIDTILRTAKER